MALHPTVKYKLFYGTDSTGFYWPGSAQKRREILGVKRNQPSTFESVYQGRPGRRVGRIFMADDFNYYPQPPTLALGITDPAMRAFCAKGVVYQAWDTAFSTSDQSAWSVCVTALFEPCDKYHRDEPFDIFGPCEPHLDVIILDVFREKMDWGGLLNAAKTQNHKWHPENVLIENRATGISLIQTLPASNVPVIGVSTGNAGKGERAVNVIDQKAAASVQGWYRQWRVLHPQEAPWLNDFEAEHKDFTGVDDGSSDQVDANVHLITHAIKIGMSSTLLPTGYGVNRVPNLGSGSPSEITHDLGITTDPREALLIRLSELEEEAFDPYAGTCGRCSNYSKGYCRVQQRSVISLDSCEFFSLPDNAEATML